MEGRDELPVHMQRRGSAWLIRRNRRLAVPHVSSARGAANRKERRLIIDSKRASFKDHVSHVMMPSVHHIETNEQSVELMDNIFANDTPVIPQAVVEHLSTLSDKQYGSNPVKDVPNADDKKNIS